jgi:RNA polymerase sigma-70 factor (ECF subfamily)
MTIAQANSARIDSAFAAIVDRNWTAVYGLLFSMTGNTPDCEDLTQETFLRALRSWDSFKEGSNLRAWLMRIALNLFFDVQRKRQKIRINRLDREPSSREKSVEERFEILEQGALVRAAMEELSESSRIVFHLRVSENLSFRQIAELTGTTEIGARWHMFEARRKLLKRLEDRSVR